MSSGIFRFRVQSLCKGGLGGVFGETWELDFGAIKALIWSKSVLGHRHVLGGNCR